MIQIGALLDEPAAREMVAVVDFEWVPDAIAALPTAIVIQCAASDHDVIHAKRVIVIRRDPIKRIRLL